MIEFKYSNLRVDDPQPFRIDMDVDATLYIVEDGRELVRINYMLVVELAVSLANWTRLTRHVESDFDYDSIDDDYDPGKVWIHKSKEGKWAVGSNTVGSEKSRSYDIETIRLAIQKFTSSLVAQLKIEFNIDLANIYKSLFD